MLSAAEEYTWWIEDCTPATAKATGCRASDQELGQWALEAWQRESAGAIVLKKSATEEQARFRMHWANGSLGLYGETRPIAVNGERGADIFVLTSVAPTSDALLRETIVYLTCLHESGHAFGLPHTRNFADIMYSFQYGGDIESYFGRYRTQLKVRADITKHSGISDADRVAFRDAIR
jgi:Peptidase M66